MHDFDVILSVIGLETCVNLTVNERLDERFRAGAVFCAIFINSLHVLLRRVTGCRSNYFFYRPVSMLFAYLASQGPLKVFSLSFSIFVI